MRKVSESELRRLKKKGKVRKKMGVQPKRETPAPVTKDGKGMSGTVPPEQPAPAPISQPEKVAVQPMASMSASMELRDGLLQDLISNNTRAIDDFRLALEKEKPRMGVPYRHTVKRGKDKLIDYVDSVPMES